MSNSTVRLYDLLKAEYPGQVYLGQIAQSVDIQSTTGVILLETISEDTSGNKDGAKRDKIVYNVHVIGLLQKTIDSLAKDIRDLIEPYNDEYIYLMEYTGTQRDRDDTGEVFRNILSFTCWNNGDGLNTPTGYWEHRVRFYNTDQHEILNVNDPNYLPISWTSFDNATAHNFNADHTYADNAIQIYAMMSIDTELEAGIKYTSTGGILTMYKEGFGNEWIDQAFLIRVRKDVTGNFLTEG